MTLEHAVEDQPGTGSHLLEGVRHQMLKHWVLAALATEGGQAVRGTLVHGDRNAERRCALPEGFVGGALDVASGIGIGAHEGAAEAMIVRAALELLDRRGHVAQGQKRNAHQPARIGLTVFREPVVVGATQDLLEFDIGQLREEERHGGIQEREIHAVEVHVVEPGLGVPAAWTNRLGVVSFFGARVLSR